MEELTSLRTPPPTLDYTVDHNDLQKDILCVTWIYGALLEHGPVTRPLDADSHV